MISMTSDWTSEPVGSVPGKCSWRPPNMSRSVPEARGAPSICASTYAGSWRHGKRPQVANAKVTAGLKCAPEMWPTAYTITMTASPHTMATPGNVICPFWLALIVTAPHPAKMRK
uniref:Nip1a n=1 Tax=Arundo donax TaxID=35708 RepID=A0A0A9B2E7_ARUDO